MHFVAHTERDTDHLCITISFMKDWQCYINWGQFKIALLEEA